MVENIIGKKLRQGPNEVTLQELTAQNGGHTPDLLGIYFGAHWAPPCRLFTPALSEFYVKLNAAAGRKRMEIVFVSNDGNEAAFERNYASMPFCAIPYQDDQRIQNLKQRFGINGIPTLVVLDCARKGELIS